ncbi:MAG TPA: CARDB domain-containing protein [Xanthomonadales bacterium]|nr:CARDB domain-containing protein [Xanthomonadales bacterium]
MKNLLLGLSLLAGLILADEVNSSKPFPSHQASLSMVAASSRVKADLFIEDVQLTPSRPTQLRVRVANQGLLAATQTELQVYMEGPAGSQTITAPVPLLKAGDRQWLVIYVGSPLAEARILTLHIDQPSQIDEIDEGNNIFVYE